MRIGVCGSLENAALLSKGLVDYFEAMVFEAIIPNASDEEWDKKRESILSLPLPIEALNCFIPPTIKTTGPDTNADQVDDYVGRVFRRAGEAGIKTIVFGSGGSRQIPVGFSYEEACEQIIGHLKRWGELATRTGITIVLEPLNQAECNFILSVPEAQRLVEGADHPNMRLLADFYHMGRSDEPAENLSKTDRLLAHIHMAEKATRMYPGFERQDFRPYFRELKKANYDGRISMECKFEDMVSEVPKAVEYIRDQWEDAK